MAYGKIKVDTLTWDNSGTDTDITVSTIPTAAQLAAKAPLASPTFTGTAVFNDLTVNGTNTVINTTTLQVEDKNIELGKVDTPTDTTADGGGITLKGSTDKEIKWVNSTDAWTFNQNIAQTLTSNGGFTATSAGDNAIQIIGDSNRNTDENTLLSLHGKWNGTNVAMIDIQAGDDTTNKDNGQIVFYTAAAGSTAEALRIHEDQSATFTGTVSDSKGDVRKIPQQNEQGSAHTLVAADAGKHILADATVTAPPTSGIFSAGDAITIINSGSSDITIAKGSGVSLHNSADGSNTDRTLAAKGMATLLCAGADTYYISGAGLS